MDHKIDIKLDVVRSGWSIRGLSEKAGITYYRLIKMLNGYQPFLPADERRVRKALSDRQAEVGIK